MTTPATSELVPQDPFQVPDDPSKMAKGQRAYYAFELRKAGASYELIADKLGYKTPESAEGAIRARLQRMYKPDAVEDVVQMELARLDALQLVAWRRAKEGDLSALDRILKIMERRAKYLGLDVKEPTHEAGTINNTAIFIGGTEEEYVAQLKQAREQATQMLNQGIQR
jgi:hypothetical protein